MTSVIRRVLLSARKVGDDLDDLEEVLRQSIITTSPKLVHAACQTLGLVGWVLMTRGDFDRNGVAPRVTACIDNLRLVQTAMLGLGSLKTQIQACRSLIILLSYDPTPSLDPLLSSSPSRPRGESLGRTLEVALLLVTKLSCTNSSEVRQKTLFRLMIVLLSLLMTHCFVLSEDKEIDESVSATIVLAHHFDDFTHWLHQVRSLSRIVHR